jgi:general secretion pathway protein A
MYKNFFGLRENPFNINPDPRFLYLTPQTQDALAQLTYGIRNRKGLILLTGEVGTGKTTLINYLLDWLHQQKMPTAFIFNSHLSVSHLFDFLLNDFGISTDFRLKRNMLLQLYQWLIEGFRKGRTPVLIIDEAQGLSFELLEEIRLLLNLETASEKLLQIVLVGQPELEDKLKRPEMRQLRQRIALRCNTAPLTLKESYGYIADRLRIAGAAGDPVFAPDAVEAVHFYSRGIPRVMNLLCEHALINAYVEQLNPVEAPMVEEAARDFLMDEFDPITTRARAGNHLDSRLSVMHSVFAKELVRPFTSQEMRSHETPHAEWTTAPAAFAVEKPAPTIENSLLATTTEREEIASSKKNLSEFDSSAVLDPALPKLERRQDEREFSLDSIACHSGSATELTATMKRMLAMAPPMPTSPLMRSRGESKVLSRAKNNRTFASENRPLIWIRGRLAFLEEWRSSWNPPLFAATSQTALSLISAAVVRWIRRPLFPVSVCKCWIVDFKRDWDSMINTFGFRQMKTSLFHRLRQSLPSKSMASGKN